MRRSIMITLSVLVVLISISSILKEINFSQRTESAVEQGTLVWNKTHRDTITLNGEWEFYKDQLLSPSDFENDTYAKTFIDVPSSWDSQFDLEEHEIDTGTYRMTVRLVKDGNYGLRVNSIRNASKVFMNGIETDGWGNPSSMPSEYEYREGKYEAYGPSQNKEIEIIIQVANLKSPNGGIVKPIQFGEESAIHLIADRSQMIDSFVVGGFLLLTIIFFFHYRQQNKSRHELYFALFSFAQSIYASTQNEKLIYLIFPAISNDVLLSTQLVSINLSTLFFLLFIYSMFHKYANLRLIKAIVLVLILQSLYYALPVRIYDMVPFITVRHTQIYLIVSLALPYLYFLWILLKAFRERLAGTEYLLLAVTSFICYGVSLGVEFLFAIDTTQLTLMLFLLMGISFSFFIAYRRRLIFENLDALSMELLVQEQLKDESLIKTSKGFEKPIEKILQAASVLMEGAEGPLKKQQQRLVYTIHNNSERLALLAKSLREARTTNEHLKIERKPMHLKVVNEIAEELSFIYPHSNEVIIENQIPADMPFVMADENSLRQVLVQLLNNALIYTKKGKIVISAEMKDQHVYISIQDTGMGMESKYFPRIFDPFYQINGGDPPDRGIGLGLPIAKQFVTLMNGEIWVDSDPGKGTCFTFSLPVAGPEHAVFEAAAGEQSPHKSRAKLTLPMKSVGSGEESKIILLIDTDRNHITYISEMLLKYGYTVIATDNSSDLPEILAHESIDLAVINMNMPGISGIDLSKNIRERYDQIELPILILSHVAFITDKNILPRTGANDFIRKPVAADEFISRVQSLLAVKEAVELSVVNELRAYQSQITPHFLFNTLNTIIGLSYTDPKRTREALAYLSVYFRSKLDYQKQQSLVALEDEIELVEAYLEIEKLRFGDKLKIHKDIAETTQVLIPALTLQPLVENAIQHGLAKKTENAALWIAVHEKEGIIKITIEDNGVGISKERQAQLLQKENQRFGFKNPIEKIRLIKNASFELESEEGEGTRIIIKLEAGQGKNSPFKIQ